MSNWEIQLQSAAGQAEILKNEPMSRHTTFQVGGPADYYIEPENAESLAALINVCRAEDIPYTVIGKGSNLLVGDKGYRVVILRIGEKMAFCDVEKKRIVAGAGITLAALARNACSAGLGGLEFAAGIPGSLGGAVTMNAGAYGGEMKDVITAVQVLTKEGEILWIAGEQMNFAYRNSAVIEQGYLVLAAEMVLEKKDVNEIKALMADLAERRRSKQPLEYHSAGSTFKRPEGYFAGKLIEDAGLKGYAVGAACVSEKHAGFVVNKGGATAADIMAVCSHVAETVQEKFGVSLEMEVKRLGDF